MKLSKFSLALPLITLVLTSASSAFAMDSSVIINKDPIPVGVTVSATAKTDADAKITARINALTNLDTRINQMVKISATAKASLDATIQASISDMTALKAKIDAGTDNATLKTDIQSITKGYRIYLLIMPQGRIIAAGDRVVTIDGLLNDLSLKLQARITSAQAAGQDVAALNASLTDMNAKMADANTQAQAAGNEVAALKPDNGDKTVFATNQATIKDARAKIKTATADLKTARQDAGSIAKALEAMNVSASATGTAQ